MAEVADASLLLGFISSVIAAVDGAKQVYNAAVNAEDLPEAFREVAERLTIVLNILASAEKHISDADVNESSCKAMKPVIVSCGRRLKMGQTIQEVASTRRCCTKRALHQGCEKIGEGE